MTNFPWVTVGPIGAAVISGIISVFVLMKTVAIQSSLKTIDEQLKRYEIEFQYLRLCIDTCTEIVEKITTIQYENCASIELRSLTARLKIILETLKPLEKQEQESLSPREFGLDADFTAWKEELIDLTYARLFSAAKSYSNRH